MVFKTDTEKLREELNKQNNMSDVVNNPEHYGGKDNPYEAIKVIEAWDLGFNLGNTVKYISRWGKKQNKENDLVQDLEKAKWYLEREINKLNISDVMVRNFEPDWRIGKYYISTTFEVVQYKGCLNGQHSMVGKGNNQEEAVKILRERNKDWKFIEQREIDSVMYFHYAP